MPIAEFLARWLAANPDDAERLAEAEAGESDPEVIPWWDIPDFECDEGDAD